MLGAGALPSGADVAGGAGEGVRCTVALRTMGAGRAGAAAAEVLEDIRGDVTGSQLAASYARERRGEGSKKVEGMREGKGDAGEGCVVERRWSGAADRDLVPHGYCSAG